MKSIFATTVFLFLCYAGTAAAQQAMHEGHKDQLDTNDNGSVSQQEYQSFMSNAFKKLDVNKNGALDKSETTDVLSAGQFTATDKNKDGSVSHKELMDRVMQDFTVADKSGDGYLQ